jgi:nucleotide-binding universal stress UspA family protein
VIPIKKILVPLDFKNASLHALDVARTLADACGASLHIIHVVGTPLRRPETLNEERQEACRRLAALLDRADREGRNATVSCELGTPAHAIVRYATEHGVDLIVMGTHGHGSTFRMATGSIAEAVLGLAPCAVLAVKSTTPDDYFMTADPEVLPDSALA